MAANKHETGPQEPVVAVHNVYQSFRYEQPLKTLFKMTPGTKSANKRNDHLAFQIVVLANHF